LVHLCVAKNTSLTDITAEPRSIYRRKPIDEEWKDKVKQKETRVSRPSDG